MKNSLVALVLLMLSSAVYAQPETLLTPDGTFYTIESVLAEDHPEIPSPAYRFLMFSMHRGEDVFEGVIPASMAAGTHSEPAFAYDSDSNRLFVFWRHTRSLSESELLFCSLNEDGQWSEVTGVDKAALRYRENFRIGITRKTEVIDEAGNKTVIPETNVHAIWWDSGDREAARYAMLTIENGVVTSTFVSYVSEIGETDEQPLYNGEPITELLKITSVLETPNRETVELVYGDLASNSIRRIRLTPVINVRIHIPIGRKETTIPSPGFAALANEQPFMIPGDDDNIVVGATSGDSVRYQRYDGHAWSAPLTLRMNKKLTTNAAMAAIRKLVSTQ